MRRTVLSGLAGLAVLLAAGCSTAPSAPPETAGFGPAPAPPTAAAPSAQPVQPLAGRAPAQQYAVGVRVLTLSNGPDRPLPTTLMYPATGRAGASPVRDAAPANGRFPVILFSHGLTGHAAGYQALLTRWAAAGFAIAAPAYPHTSFGVAKFDVLDVANQPADASAVLNAALALNTTAGDPLRGKLRTDSVAAAGHSAGGITTVGLFTKARDARLRAGIVLAGSSLGFGDLYSGPPASLLFVHGGLDDVVSYESGRAAYDKVPWGKALLSLPQDGHGDPYLRAGDPGFTAVATVTTDFLRWSLYGDTAAKSRLGRGAGRVGTLDNRL